MILSQVCPDHTAISWKTKCLLFFRADISKLPCEWYSKVGCTWCCHTMRAIGAVAAACIWPTLGTSLPQQLRKHLYSAAAVFNAHQQNRLQEYR